ncbi:anaerobic ribonucleoside-triphosphate reductase [Parapedobacter pyrenivorans]|uniref:anaerobic ribonucleoside-triphosphate reductase n=1 Tax=Parapedobacter pyrenivorans TaxID=1305674 RepID=UPI001667F75B|nr:anaerobic ribonucleoside-triphosphate reductase [Parapedobacter pyrenivorans]
MNIQQQHDLILQQYQEKRNKCLVYTRVMGYHRPVESFNVGKKGEHRQRTHFTERSANAHL